MEIPHSTGTQDIWLGLKFTKHGIHLLTPLFLSLPLWVLRDAMLYSLKLIDQSVLRMYLHFKVSYAVISQGRVQD